MILTMKIYKVFNKSLLYLIEKYLYMIAGKEKMQFLFEKLLRCILTGMNYGPGADYTQSGELFVLSYVQKKLKNQNDLILFDVGANIGGYSNYLAAIFPKNRIIHSFEPSKNTFNELRENTTTIDNIIISNIGLSDQAGQRILYSSTHSSGLSSVYNRQIIHHGIKMEEKEKIWLETIDNYCAKHKIDKIHFLKLDIEGHELFALKGAERMISNMRIDFIQFEFGGCNIDSRTYFQDFFYLLKDKYKIYRILKDGIKEIRHYSENNEIFLTVNYLAENRNFQQL